jgi:hypothetical protein
MRVPYKNLSGNSGVVAYEIGPGFIRVWFANRAGIEGYEYDETKPGKHHVDEMKGRAEGGKGLAAYISRRVRTNYARKL